MAEDPGFTVDLAHLAAVLGPDPMSVLLNALGQPNLISQYPGAPGPPPSSEPAPYLPIPFQSIGAAANIPLSFPLRDAPGPAASILGESQPRTSSGFFDPYSNEARSSIATRGIAAPQPQGMAPPLPQQTPPTQSPGNPPGPPRINMERALPPPGGFEGAGGVPEGLQQILMRIFSQRGLPFPSRGTGMFPGMGNQFGPGGLSNFGGGFGGAGGGDMSQILSMLGMRPDLLMDLLERQKRGMGQMGGM